MNQFTQGLRAGQLVTLVNAGGRNPDLAPMLARCGATAVFVDCERTGIGLDAAGEVMVAARACGLAAVVRPHARDFAQLVQFLDRGADALVVPHIDSIAQVQEAVEAVRYACGDAAGQRSLVIQIETRGALEALADIAGVPGVDGFLIGPNDIAYEFTGQRGKHTAASRDAIENACSLLWRLRRPFGYPARPEDLAQFHQRRATLHYLSVDWLLEAGMQQCIQPGPV